MIDRYSIPTQSCVLCHVTTSIDLMERGAPVDLVFQSIAGTQAANASFGVTLGLLDEAYEAARSLARGTVGSNALYFETGQGSALSADAHHGVDQQTVEARAYAVARRYDPLLVNTVVGFIGPEYLYDGRQILRAALEDHFCGKLLGLPMGLDICYTNHADADDDDIATMLTMLGVAGASFVICTPEATTSCSTTSRPRTTTRCTCARCSDCARHRVRDVAGANRSAGRRWRDTGRGGYGPSADGDRAGLAA